MPSIVETRATPPANIVLVAAKMINASNRRPMGDACPAPPNNDRLPSSHPRPIITLLSPQNQKETGCKTLNTGARSGRCFLSSRHPRRSSWIRLFRNALASPSSSVSRSARKCSPAQPDPVFQQPASVARSRHLSARAIPLRNAPSMRGPPHQSPATPKDRSSDHRQDSSSAVPGWAKRQRCTSA